MGYGEYSGNQSVHWSVTHEDDKGKAVKLAARTGRSAHPTEGARPQRGPGRARPGSRVTVGRGATERPLG